MKQIVFILLVLLPVCTFSQVTESFDGPEITSANPWKGELDKFVINSDGWLQLNDPAKKEGKASLQWNIRYASDMQWEFDVRIEKKPSDSNYLRLYLYIEDEDTYYYVQIGHDGNKKISLCTNGKKSLFPEKESNLTEEPVLLQIKVTLKDDKEWTLYSRKIGDDCYREEGSCLYPVKNPQENGMLILNVFYSKTRYQHFAIDNIRISHEISPTITESAEKPTDPGTEDPAPPPGVILPKLQSVELLSLSELQFIFDLPVEKDKATFSIQEIGDADRTNYADVTKSIVNTHFPKEMIPGETYTLSYKGVTDLSGNKLSSYSQSVNLEEENKAKPGSVCINEIMADPKGLRLLPETEYVELYNTSEETISTNGWILMYGETPIVLDDLALPAGKYAVLYRAGREIKVDDTGMMVPLVKFPSQLANNGKLLQLKDDSGNLIDEVNYQKAKPGVSWERSGNDWQLSVDPRGGTPGSKNTQSGGEPEKPDPGTPGEPLDPILPGTIEVEPFELIFNELLPDPFTGGCEYVELYNRSDHSLSLTDLSLAVRKTDGTFSTRYPLQSVETPIESGGYALLAKNKEGVADFYTIQSPSNLFEIAKLPILANTSSCLVLFRTKDEVVIDEVQYSSKWHATSVRNQKGVALERIHPDKKTQDASNWTSAAVSAGYGTPGYQNSQIGTISSGDVTGMEPPVFVEGTDLYEIVYLLDQPGYSCKASVFNISGRRVAEVANHELLGISGTLTWKGISLSGDRLLAGVYIFYAELYHITGKVKTCKKVFLMK